MFIYIFIKLIMLEHYSLLNYYRTRNIFNLYIYHLVNNLNLFNYNLGTKIKMTFTHACIVVPTWLHYKLIQT